MFLHASRMRNNRFRRRQLDQTVPFDVKTNASSNAGADVDLYVARPFDLATCEGEDREVLVDLLRRTSYFAESSLTAATSHHYHPIDPANTT